MKTTRLLSLLLTAALLLSLLPAGTTLAAWDGTGVRPTAGAGTSASPFQILTAENLKWFADEINIRGNLNIHAKLMNDIELNSAADIANWQNWATSAPARTWTPIGDMTNKFVGSFDGQGNTISGVYVNSNSANYQGLFGYIGPGASIRNIRLTKSYIRGVGSVGGIVGIIASSSTVSGCSSGATVVGTSSSTGGIAGSLSQSSVIENCTNSGSIAGSGSTGGVVGSNSGRIENPINTGNISSTGNMLGGICGINSDTITYAYNTGSVSNASGYYVGGICGYNSGEISWVFGIGPASGAMAVGRICGANLSGASILNAYYLTGAAGVGGNAGSAAAAEKSASQFSSGEVAYLLGSKFGQTLGTDTHPMFRSLNDSNRVYKLTYMSEGAEYAAQYYNAGAAVSSAGITPPTMDGGAFLDWAGLPDTMPPQDVTATANSTPAPPQIMTTSLPAGAAHKAYSTRIEATGTSPIAFSVVSGALPTGLTLNEATGEITGMPAAAGSSTLVIRAQNDYGENDKEFILDVSDEMPGIGTLGDPYQIWTASHLIEFANMVNTSSGTRFYAVLMADIALNDTSDWENWATSAPANAWTPIGISSTYNFKGGFDGNNHTISGVYINGSDNNIGLFGYISAATTVKNLSLVESYIKGNENVGGICGSLMTLCKLENCRNAAVVTGVKYAGGVCGIVNANNASILNCQNDGAVTGSECVGGIAGTNAGTIGGCRNSGTVQGSAGGRLIGGICGNNGGAISNAYSTGSVSGNLNIGGICGYSAGMASTYATISRVHSTGTIGAGQGNGGGICGATNVYSTLDNCYFLSTSASAGVGYNLGSGSSAGKTQEQLASGEVAYLLGVAFGQTLGTDDTPVFRTSDPNNAVYRLTYMKNDTVEHAAQYYNAGNTVSAEGIANPTSTDGIFRGWDTLPAVMPAYDLSVMAVFTPNTPPTAKATVPTQSVKAGETTSFDADDIAEDADNDLLAITAIVTVPASGTATASLSNGAVTITGMAAGSTSVTVTVSDGTDTVDVAVPIEVTAAASETYALTITGGTGGSITQGSSGNYAAGAVINIAASPDANYAFAGWTSSGGGVFGDVDSAATTFTMPAQAVTITASFIYTGGSGGGSAPTYRTRLLRDSVTGIQISGSAIHRRAVLTVKDMALHPEGSCTACDTIRKAQNDNQLILGFDIDLTQGFHGSLTISVPVDNRHDGQTVTMLHCINGRLETLTATVVNGKATFTVTSLSPFAVTSGLLTPDFVVTDPPKTGDASAQTGYVMLGLAALCALYPVMRRRKKERE